MTEATVVLLRLFLIESPIRMARLQSVGNVMRGEAGIQTQFEFRVRGLSANATLTVFAERAAHPNPLP